MKDPTLADLKSPARSSEGWWYVVTLKSGEQQVVADTRAYAGLSASIREARRLPDDWVDFSGVQFDGVLLGKGGAAALEIASLAYDDDNEEVEEAPADHAAPPERPRLFPAPKTGGFSPPRSA